MGNVGPDHHIGGDMLLTYAAGALNEAPALVVAAHLAMCPRCRAALDAAEAAGGVLLDEVEPADVSPSCLSDTLERLDAPAPRDVAARKRGPVSVMGTPLPHPIADYMPGDAASLRWQFVSPGVRFAELLRDPRGVRVGLMHTKAGASITQHGHGGEEMTLVLSGGFRDASGVFRRGDLQTVDENYVHAPVVDPQSACLALVMMQAKPRPTSLVARILRHFTAF